MSNPKFKLGVICLSLIAAISASIGCTTEIEAKTLASSNVLPIYHPGPNADLTCNNGNYSYLDFSYYLYKPVKNIIIHLEELQAYYYDSNNVMTYCNDFGTESAVYRTLPADTGNASSILFNNAEVDLGRSSVYCGSSCTFVVGAPNEGHETGGSVNCTYQLYLEGKWVDDNGITYYSPKYSFCGLT